MFDFSLHSTPFQLDDFRHGALLGPSDSFGPTVIHLLDILREPLIWLSGGGANTFLGYSDNEILAQRLERLEVLLGTYQQ